MDWIRIAGLRLSCIVGVRPQERGVEQPVVLDLGLGLDLSQAGRSGRIVQTCDYDVVASDVCELLRFRQYQLIEVATEEISAMLLGIYPGLLAVQITLAKPQALRGRARNASVQIHRERSDLVPRRVHRTFGTLEVLLATREAGLYLIRVDAGQALCPIGEEGQGRPLRSLAWVVAGELALGSRRFVSGDRVPLVAPGDRPLSNLGSQSARVFACVVPALGL